MFPSIFFWLICRGCVKNVFNVLCLLWESLVMIDSWRDSFSLGEFHQPPSATSVMSQSEKIMSHWRAALDGKRNLWQPRAAGRHVRWSELIHTCLSSIFSCFSFALHATMRLMAVKEDVQPWRSKVCLFWIWWIRPVYFFSLMFSPPFIPSYSWLHFPPLSSLLPPFLLFLPLSLSIICFPVNSSETVLRTQTKVNKV